MDEPNGTASSDSPSAPFVVRSYGATDRGLKRPTNEDQFLIADLTKAMRVRQTSLEEPGARFGEQHGHLFLVADGMGGHHAGEHASAMAVTLIEQFALNTFRWFMPLTAVHADNVVTDFQEAVEHADATIVEAATKSPDLRGMGTTLTLAFHYETELLVIHVGDSRAYLFRDNTLRQLTRDHTVVAELVRRGELDLAEVRQHRLRHIITNVVGGTESGVQAEAHTLKLHVDDELLLCSDGLTEMLSNAEITEVLRGEPNPEAACMRLISLANACGGQDNITAIVARFSASPATTGNAFGNEP
jgi:protein phosphatase